MPIIIKTNNNINGIPEWGIIELQGDLEVRGNKIMMGQFIGDLCYDKYGQPILIIGHHILHGKEIQMDKPYAVLEKCQTSNNNNNNDEDGGDNVNNLEDTINFNKTTRTENLDESNISIGGGGGGGDTTTDRTILDTTIAIEHKTNIKTEYLVKAIVKKKLLFKTRPKPIIANLSKHV